jgi:hypothetical protein
MKQPAIVFISCGRSQPSHLQHGTTPEVSTCFLQDTTSLFPVWRAFSPLLAAVSYTLSSMGDEVIPALLIAITNADQQARLRTVVNLGARAVDEAGVIDALLERLAADLDATVRSASAHALGRFPALPHEAMEGLVTALDDPVSYVAANAALALGTGFGPRASSVVPALLDHWRRTGYSTSEALTLVDPETAKMVGAMHPPNPYE